jgi:hypothetical protein
MQIRRWVLMAITLVIGSFANTAESQPGTPGCVQAKQTVATLEQQLTTLKAQRSDPKNAGAGTTEYNKSVERAQAAVSSAVGRESEACATKSTDSRSGSLSPKYMVLAVIYAPPGTDGGKSTSSVDYSSGSTLGTSVSTSDSFKNALSLSVSAMGGFFGSGVTVSFGFDTSVDRTDKNSVDIKKSEKSDIKVSGPSIDGINHDDDRIYLWLNPRIDVKPQGGGQTWTPSLDGSFVDIQYVLVAWLKNPQLLPADLAKRLAARGIGKNDYDSMLSADPFSRGDTRFDPARFILTETSWPYEPPGAPSEPSGVETETITNESTETNTTQVVNALSLSIGLTVEGGVAGFSKATLKVSDKFTWTHTSSASDSEGSTQMASVSIGQPAFGYTGPTDLLIYWDRLWGTFVFGPAPFPAKLVTGVVTDATKRPVRFREVLLTMPGHRYRTFTSATGHYSFPGDLPKGQTQAQIQIGTITKSIMLDRTTVISDFQLGAPRPIDVKPVPRPIEVKPVPHQIK